MCVCVSKSLFQEHHVVRVKITNLGEGVVHDRIPLTYFLIFPLFQQTCVEPLGLGWRGNQDWPGLDYATAIYS